MIVGEFYQGKLELGIIGFNNIVRVNDVPLRGFCKNNREEQLNADGYCEVNTDETHNLLKGWNDKSQPEYWFKKTQNTDDELSFEMFSDVKPITWFDIDFDGDLEILIPSMCNIRMSPLMHVFEISDLTKKNIAREIVEPAFSFLSNAIFYKQERKVVQQEANDACSFTEVTWRFDTDSKRFVQTKVEDINC